MVARGIRQLTKGVRLIIAALFIIFALNYILHRSQLSTLQKLLLVPLSTFATKTEVQSSSQRNDSKGISNNKVNLLNSILTTQQTTTHKGSTPTTITSTLKTTNGTVKPVNSTKSLQSKDFLSNYKFINKHSKRYNTTVDLRPKIILGSIDKYKDLAELNKMVKIPQIIHQTNRNDMVSMAYKEWMKSWLRFNPNWQYWFWTDEDIRKFITTRYPDFLQIFNGYKMAIMRADVFRYFLLYEFGGVYADCDMECLKPLDAKMAEHDCIVSLEPAIQSLIMYNREHLTSNAFMASRPMHPFFKFVIDFLSENNRHNHGDPVYSTGPTLLASAYDDISKNTTENLPHLPDADVYQPKADPMRITQFVQACQNMVGKFNKKIKAEETCKPFLQPQVNNGPKNNSYAVHHWTHNWVASDAAERSGFSVREVLKNVSTV